ncbi:hypothetical protein EVC29_095 [Rhizobium phage RHph_Y52]|nr:hypothetical protein EVC16_095 [Rhizobium phage RHph_Y21]QIG76796.1 hypothetical protein EVC29_095 [Rhizobium phage RHph_Y52]
MRITTVPRDVLIAKQKAINVEIEALRREKVSLPLCEANVERLQQIQDRTNALHDEFRTLNNLRVSY